ncbi:N-acetylmannosamine-6-phosphate 2-epimerase [Paenibacillus swuensis]|uniref:Putative N-acetylmannosamine-6-phosphate 2-epimerase n=1 Tax=Paenibacillus swuensis TaxID=1178515 RepID=A0A172TJU4_9BACL|nr:N-acetylmannosamine-6-phosphate 2-epimerase [Paenibacillus swuensis]ANE47242.1 N-acetylmannosamine-6-phosphate 2-epimerase [Paenibacillus swuensis]
MLVDIKGRLVVSCQALSDEPLHGSEIMKRMADAAMRGGAAAIRANGVEDVAAIKSYVDLPVIGLIKRDYPDSEVYITPTLIEVEQLIGAGADMIALDATNRTRPGGVRLSDMMRDIRAAYPSMQWMADCSTLEECVQAEKLGFDCIGTTMHGYTAATAGKKLYEADFSFLRAVVREVAAPVLAEGNILTPEMAAHALDAGAHAVVVGGAITRPQQITERFAEAIRSVRA